VGYAGGKKHNPTYHSLGDHTETLQVEYDPTRVSYEELLEIFWDSHNPTRRSWSKQYMAAIFYHNDAQKAAALASKAGQAVKRNSQILTDVLPATTFYLAEDYHQKYMLRHTPELMAEYSAIYPNPKDFVNSTAAARVNGYVSGYGSIDQLQAELTELGLSAQGEQHLLKLARRYYGE
jgi:peptide-methionine (S)-S-oxide reductase